MMLFLCTLYTALSTNQPFKESHIHESLRARGSLFWILRLHHLTFYRPKKAR